MSVKEGFIKSGRFILLMIILLGASLRSINLFSPILDLYPIRQEYCAMVARNFLTQGMNIFNPQVDWLGSYNSYWTVEFPLVSFLAAALYKIFGLHEYLGRIVAIVFSLGSVYFLYKLVRLYFNEKVSLFSAFMASVLPWGVYFGRAFMPDSSMIFFSVLSLYLCSLWARYGRNMVYIGAILATALAFLAKIYSFYIFLPILFIFYIKYGKHFLTSRRFWIFWAVALAPVLFWYARSTITVNNYIFDWNNFGYLLNKDFYKKVFDSIALFILTPIGLALLPLGLLAKVEDKKQYLFHFWFLSALSCLIIFPKLNYLHYHYQLPLVLPSSVFLGRALAIFMDKGLVRRSIFGKSLGTKTAIAIILSVFLFFPLAVLRPCYKWNRAAYEAGRLINDITPADSIVIAGRCTGEAPLYYSGRKGWEMNEEGNLSYVYDWARNDPRLGKFIGLNEIETVKRLVEDGADYYFSVNMRAFNSNPELVKFMRGNYKVLRENSKYIIFVLK